MFGKRLLPALMVSFAAYAQVEMIAPEFRRDDDLHSYLGLVNPERTRTLITLTGFSADGVPAGEATRGLPPFARFEEGPATLFPDIEGVAWLHVHSQGKVVGYVRYQVPGSDQTSMAPLNRFTDQSLWVPAVLPDETLPISGNTVVNAGDTDGVVNTRPYRDPNDGGSSRRVFYPLAPAPLTPGQGQERFRYDALYADFPLSILWDRIQSDNPLTGIQHLSDANGGMATHHLQTTLHREMIATDLHGDGAATRVVLVNTNPDSLEVEVTLYDIYQQTLTYLITLEARERRIIDLDDRENLPQSLHTVWAHFKAHETGLAGFMLTDSEGARTTTEIGEQFSSLIHLPYTPGDQTHQTRITMINPEPGTRAITYIYGFNDNGELVKRIRANIGGLEKVAYDTAELFGDSASEITWVRVLALTARLGVWSLTSPRNGGDYSAFRGIPTLTRREDRQLAGFEFIRPLDLPGQGWTLQDLKDETYRTVVIDEVRDRFSDGHSKPLWGQFFTETAHFPPEGQHYLAYEPLFFNNSQPDRKDQVMFISPLVEVPPYGAYHLSYQMRFFDPQNATEGSRYGLAWRMEGEETWHWFGLTGYLLAINPPVLIGDCWFDVGYRSQGNLVTRTNWFHFQAPLPAEIHGKRIQFAYFYDHTPSEIVRQGPTMHIDDVRLTTHPDRHAFYYEDATGVLLFKEED
ncbi:MAG: hypothetical protein QNK37_28790 [Acidobacteriota bacterium]|nr:hypothetical protein [Acidobacteriota bacterium]